MPIFKLMGPSKVPHSTSILPTSIRDWSLHFSAQVAPEQAQRLALQDVLPDSQLMASVNAQGAEVHSSDFGEHILVRVTFSGALIPQILDFHSSVNKDSWCLVLTKVASANAASLLGPGIGRVDMDYAIEPPRIHPHRVEMLTLIIPSSSVQPVVLDMEQFHGGNAAGATLALATYIDNLVSLLPSLTSDDAVRVSAMTRALIAAYFAPPNASCDPAKCISKPLLFERAQRIVRQHMLSSDFGPEQLCRLLAVSRSKLYRLFESSGGVANFVNSERLNYAHERLADPRGLSTINKIGADVGFCDHSTFSRVFKRKFGYSPSEARNKTSIRLESAPPFGDDLDQMSDKLGCDVAS